MHCIVYILFIFFLVRIGCVPSGLKIKNATDAKNYQYPFIVKLERRIILAFVETIHVENNVHICTCVALSPSWTLTAGHCIDGTGPIKDLTDNLSIQTVIRYGNGSLNGNTVKVLSIIIHPSSQDPLLKMQNDIGLLRTEMIRIQQYARISAIDINTLGGQELTLAGHSNIIDSSRRLNDTLVKRTPLQLLNVLVVRYDNINKSTLPEKCVANRCLSTSTTCDGDSGGPLLHSTGVIGINTVSLENVKLCSVVNKNQLIGMEIITPTKPHIKWINNYIQRDAPLPPSI